VSSLFDLLVNGILTLVGVAFGWWFRASRRCDMTLVDQADGQVDAQRAREALARLHELAAKVKADVGAHSHRVEEINEELTATDSHGAETVVAVVAKLMEANSQMQRQLASAEDRLDQQARQLESETAAARTDPLTQLANRRALDDELARRIAESRRHGSAVSIVMIDVDHFKKFNDAHGHLAGDEVLRGVAQVLRGGVRQSDFVARYGGEEFTLVLPHTPIDGAQPLVEKIREQIAAARFLFNGRELCVTASLGLAQLLPGEEAERLIERADAALYASKSAGRNCAHWHDGRTTHPCRSPAPPATAPRAAAPPATVPPSAAPRATPPAERPPRATVPAEPTPRPAPTSRPAEPAGTPSRSDQDRNPPEAQLNPLARLVNRTAFCTSLGNRLAESRRGGAVPSVVLARIDHYDRILAEHGPQVMDLLMRTTAKFLLAAVREMDLVAYYDHSTFAMMLPGTPLADVARVAERLRRAIANYTL